MKAGYRRAKGEQRTVRSLVSYTEPSVLCLHSSPGGQQFCRAKLTRPPIRASVMPQYPSFLALGTPCAFLGVGPQFPLLENEAGGKRLPAPTICDPQSPPTLPTAECLTLPSPPQPAGPNSWLYQTSGNSHQESAHHGLWIPSRERALCGLCSLHGPKPG